MTYVHRDHRAPWRDKTCLRQSKTQTSEEYLCEIIFDLGKQFRFYIWGSGGHFVWWSRTVWVFVVEGLMRNICVKLFLIWASGLGEWYRLKEKLMDEIQHTMHDHKSPPWGAKDLANPNIIMFT